MTARKSSGPKGVPRHQLAPINDEGTSSNNMPNPRSLNKKELVEELENLQIDHKIVLKTKQQDNEVLGEYREENDQLQTTVHRLKKKLGKLQMEKGELQGIRGHMERRNLELEEQVGFMQVQVHDSAAIQQSMHDLLEVRTGQRDEAWALENGYRQQINTLQIRVGEAELWNEGLHAEVHLLNN